MVWRLDRVWKADYPLNMGLLEWTLTDLRSASIKPHPESETVSTDDTKGRLSSTLCINWIQQVVKCWLVPCWSLHPSNIWGHNRTGFDLWQCTLKATLYCCPTGRPGHQHHGQIPPFSLIKVRLPLCISEIVQYWVGLAAPLYTCNAKQMHKRIR